MLFHFVRPLLVRPLLFAFMVLMLPASGIFIKGATAGIFSPDMPGWANKYSCSSCHTIDKKLVGPAWIDVARKYKGDGAAAAGLSDKITKGGGGVWGAMPMPPNSQVSDAEKKEMIRFILGLVK